MKKLITLLLLIGFCKCGFSQMNLQWGFSVGDQLGALNITSLTSDSNGDVIAMGHFGGTVDFDPGPANSATVAPGSFDNIFVARYSSAGTFTRVFVFGSNGQIRPNEVISDNAGALYINGCYTDSFDIDPGSQTFVLPGTSNFKGFFAKFTSVGHLIWAKSFDDGSDNYVHDLAVGISGSLHLSGSFNGSSMDLDPGWSTLNVPNPGTSVTYLSTFDTAGNFVDSWYYQNNLSTFAIYYSIDYLSDGSLILYGGATGAMDVDPTSGTAYIFGGSHNFLMRYISDSLAWCSLLTISTGYGCVGNLAVNSNDDILLSGQFDGEIDMDPGAGIDTINNGQGTYDIYVASYSSSGNLNWAHSLGSQGHDEITGIAIDQSDNIYLTGELDGAIDFDASTATALDSSTNFTRDPFILVYSQTGGYLQHYSFGTANNIEQGISATATNSGVVFSGQIRGTVDVQPGSGTVNIGDMFSDGYLISYDFVLGISTFEMTDTKLYPNPMNNYTNVKLPITMNSGNVEIYNALGQLVSSFATTNNEFVIERNNLPAGIYSVIVTSDSKVARAQLIIN